MDILVIGGTGTVGTHAVGGLVERGETPRVMTRDPGKGSVEGAEYVKGALGEADAVASALEGIEAVLMITPLHPQEAEIGVAAVDAMADAGVGRIVFQSVQDVRSYPDPPHFASKIAIEDAIAATGIPYTVVGPSSFLQNDLRMKEAIVGLGVYPQPLGENGVTRVDVRDVAEAHVRALLDLDAEGETWPVTGPGVWTAPEIAATWSRALGREVAYGGDDLDAWADLMSAHMPAWMIEDLAEMFAAFQRSGWIPDEAAFDRAREIVGHEPRTFEAFAEETARAWTG